ncbi:MULTISPECIES: hypothetical protein [Haloferax]|uniref:Uncharacterized protein n=1 Tax=Haloferax gibbonsii TaxID=35746 RepID=A0A0K1IUC1_HALGI|nr:MULTISPECIES: hypothetical protein [Haloferax]AKU08147.1 hypothetical protein ABY42_10515 [Haloferax gibbonsii]RDZ52700.1 hypothetical protein C5C07_13100 [Haloferax sp. Atlit-4N]
MSRWLPPTYSFLLFVVPALLLAVVPPFFSAGTSPSVGELVVVPAVITVFANVGYVVRGESPSDNVVDERDVRNIDRALSTTGGVMLASLVGLFASYALSTQQVPSAVTFLAVAGLGTVFCVLGATELRQRV